MEQEVAHFLLGGHKGQFDRAVGDEILLIDQQG